MQKIGTIEDILRSGNMNAADLIQLVQETQAKLDAEKAAKAQADSKGKEARQQVIAATLNYLEAVDMAPDDDASAKTFEQFFNILFDELEKSIEQAKQKAVTLDLIMKNMKESSPRPTVKKANISDDEKLLNFLKKNF